MPPTRPSFVCFVADQCRYDLLGCAGHPARPTPNIDRMAEEGVRFDRCYSVHPLCMPTRATWATGQTPRSHGVRCNGVPLRRDVPTMTEALRQSGYQTHSIGKLHYNLWMAHPSFRPEDMDPADWPEARVMWESGRVNNLPMPYYGFETVDFMGGTGQGTYGNYRKWLLEREPRGLEMLAPPPDMKFDFAKNVETTWELPLPEELSLAAWGTECAEKFLERAARDGRPFFLWLSIHDPHPPYAAPAPWSRRFRPEDMPEPTRREGELDDLPPHYRRLFETGLPTAGRIAPTNVPDDARRRVAAMICGMVAQLDDMVGRVLGKLDALGLSDDTVALFTSDHGQMLGDHWMFSMPPCHLDGTLRVPSVWRYPHGFRRGLTTPALASHLDFAPTVLDLARVPQPDGFAPPVPEAELQRPAMPGRSLLNLLTGAADTVQDSVIAEDDEDYLGLRLRTLITDQHHLTLYAGQPYGELYDLESDPGQLHNLWHTPDARALRRHLMAQLGARFAETDSALPRRVGHA